MPSEKELQMSMDEIVLKLEIDSPIETGQINVGAETTAHGVSVTVTSRQSGHGFGMSEVIEVLVIVGTGVASDIAAEVLRSCVGTLIRKVQGRGGSSDGSREDIARLLDGERNSQRSADAIAPQVTEPKNDGKE